MTRERFFRLDVSRRTRGSNIWWPHFERFWHGTTIWLIIAGKVDRCEEYWSALRENISGNKHGRIVLRDEFIPDEETEVYFKAADALVLSYRDIYQSGVLVLGHSFGLPVLASDVGSFRDEIVEGKTGFVFRPEDPEDMAVVIERYFASDLYLNLKALRPEIRDYAAARHSWDLVGEKTMSVYASLLGKVLSSTSLHDDVPTNSVDANAVLKKLSNSGSALYVVLD